MGFDKARKLTPYPLPIVNEGNVEGQSRFAYYESLSDIGYAEIVRIPPIRQHTNVQAPLGAFLFIFPLFLPRVSRQLCTTPWIDTLD